jgi:flagellar motor switch protein FliN/FliY
MTNSLVDSAVDLDPIVRAAAEGVIGVLPLEQTLVAGEPGRLADIPGGRAVTARFTGSLSGEIVIVVDRPVVDALAESPLGPLELAQALKPALLAAARPLGRVALGPVVELDGATALAALPSKPDALIVALLDDDTPRAAVGIALTSVTFVEDSLPPDQPTPRSTVVSTDTTTMGTERAGMDLLRAVEMDVTAELGRTRMTLNELLSLTDGALIELDRAAGAPADVLVNGRLIARGEVVVIDENFGLRITEIVSDNGTR